MQRSMNLLDTGEARRLTTDPGALYRELIGLPPKAWGVIDEGQPLRAQPPRPS
jgi:hypothetical protein